MKITFSDDPMTRVFELCDYHYLDVQDNRVWLRDSSAWLDLDDAIDAENANPSVVDGYNRVTTCWLFDNDSRWHTTETEKAVVLGILAALNLSVDDKTGTILVSEDSEVWPYEGVFGLIRTAVIMGS